MQLLGNISACLMCVLAMWIAGDIIADDVRSKLVGTPWLKAKRILRRNAMPALLFLVGAAGLYWSVGILAA